MRRTNSSGTATVRPVLQRGHKDVSDPGAVLPSGRGPDITDEHGRPVLHVDGKVLSLRNRLVLRDPDGREVAQVQRKLIAMRPTYQISIRRGGQTVATISKQWFSMGDTSAVDVALARTIC